MGWHIRWPQLLVAVGVLLVLAPAVALAQTGSALEGKFRAGDNIDIGPEEIVEDDLYVTAGNIRVAGTVNGDLIASGGQIDISGSVDGDVIVAGGTVSIAGDVSGDGRIAAGQLRVVGTIAEDLVAATGTLTVATPAEIGRDLVFTTGQTVVDGTVGGNVLGRTGNYDVAGQIGGSQQVIVVDREAPTVAQRIWSVVQRWVSLVLVAALLLWLVPATIRRSRDTARAEALPAAGVGILGVIAIPLALTIAAIIVALLAALFGVVRLGQLAGTVAATGFISVAVGGIVFAFVVVFVAQVIVSLLLGSLIRQPQGWGRQLVATAIGAIPLVVLFAIPVVGGWIQFVVVVLGLGALILALWRTRRRAPQQPPEPYEPEPVAEGAA